MVNAVRRWIASPWTRLKWLQLVFLGLTLVSIGLGFQNAVGGQQAASLAGISFLVGVILPYVSDGIKSVQDRKDTPADTGLPPDQVEALMTAHRGDLLGSVKRIVDAGLAITLARRIRLVLALRPSAVDNPLPGGGPQPSGGADQALAPGTEISAVYEDQGKQLLILGTPGGGKSGLLYELGAHLLSAAETDPSAPIPVLFDLAAWPDETVPLEDWLISELNRNYGVAEPLGREWLALEKFIPLLDGLDQAGDDGAGRCVEAINKFREIKGQLPLVVCSRLEEYESLDAKLELRAAVVVQPVDKADILECLAGPDFAVIRELQNEDEGLAELLSTPLFLSIVVLTYGGKPADSIPKGTMSERRMQVLADYVRARLGSGRGPAEQQYTPAQTSSWLAWLARQVKSRHKEDVFYYDLIQPDWLPNSSQRRMATVGLAAAVGVLVGLLAFAGNAPIFGLFGGVVLGLTGGLVAGLAAYEPVITPTAGIKWSWSWLRSNLLGWLTFGPVFGVLAGLSVGVIAQMRGGWVGWLALVFSGLIAGLFLGLFFALVGGLESPPYLEPKGPGQGMTSKRNALKGGGLLALVSGVLAGIGGGLIVELAVLPADLRADLFYWLVPGLILQGLAFGFLISLAFGFDPGIRIGLGGNRLRTGLIVGLGVALVDGQVGGLMAGHNGWLGGVLQSHLGGKAASGLVAAVLLAPLVGIGTGIVHGLLRGGGTYLRHRVLMALLVRDGSVASDYLGLLNYATRINLLERHGGGYRFLHLFLLDYFAGLPGAGQPTAERQAVPVGAA